MATIYPVEQEWAQEAITVDAIIASDNLLELIDDNLLTRIGSNCLEGFEADLQSRKTGDDDADNWEARYKRYLDIAMQVRKAKTFPWPKACYSLDTEILTGRGWLPVAEIKIGDKAYAMQDDGTAAFEPVVSTFRGLSGRMVHFKGKSVDLMVSDNHQMVLADKSGNLEFRRADDVALNRPTNRYIPLTSNWHGNHPHQMHGMTARSYVRMLGWYLSEGWAFRSINKYTTKAGEERNYGPSYSSFGIGQSKEANPEKYDVLAADLMESGLSHKATGVRGFLLRAGKMADSLKEQFRSLGTQEFRYIPEEVKELSSELLSELLDTMILGDGTVSKKNGHRSYFTVSRRLADDVQEIAQKIGLRASITNEGKRNGVIDGREVTAQHDIYCVSINRKTRCQTQKVAIEVIERATEIACIEVPSHRLYVRRNGVAAWCGNSNVKLPLLCTAALQFQARAYPVIIDGSNLVKGRVLGADPDGEKRARADRIGEHMTWQLLFDMPGWEEDTDRLLLQLPIVGSVFRKTYFDPIQKRNVSKTVTALDFVINYWAESIEAAPRYTHVIRLYPHEVIERMRSGLWRTITLPTVQDHDDQSETAPIEFLEQFCRLDLDEDGYPEPYVVTLLRESGEVVRITPCYDEDGVTVNMQTGQVIRIDPKQYFTQYGFVPSPDGSFYYMGFGSLLDDITASIDATVNQLLDAGALQNAQGGFIGSGVNIRSGDLKFRLGEWKRVDVTGGNLRENIVPLNLPGPSAVLFSLLELLIGFAKEITSIQDILTGAAAGVNTPATTTLAQIEQATKLMTGIFKRVHRSFWQELKILFGLNRDFLDEEAFYELFDAPEDDGTGAPSQAGQIGRADYQDKDLDVMPVSDPTQINDALKAVRAQALLAFNGDPLVNQEVIRRRYFEGTGQPNVRELMTIPKTGPTPEMLAGMAEMENKRDETKSKIRLNNSSAAKNAVDAAKTAAEMGLTVDAAVLAGAGVQLGTDAADMENNGESIDRAGGDAGMEGEPADGGVPGLPVGQAEGLDGGMGLGGSGGSVGGGVPDPNGPPVQ